MNTVSCDNCIDCIVCGCHEYYVLKRIDKGNHLCRILGKISSVSWLSRVNIKIDTDDAFWVIAKKI